MKYLLYIRLRLKNINVLKTHNENMKKTLATTTTTTKKQQQVEQNVFYYFFSLFLFASITNKKRTEKSFRL